MPLSVIPDVETITVQALNAQPSITALVGARIYAWIPATPVYPLIRVTKTASLFVDEEGLEDARLFVECWADDDNTASLLARTVVAARKDLKGIYAAGWVALTDVFGSVPLHDPNSERFRWTVDLEMSVGVNP